MAKKTNKPKPGKVPLTPEQKTQTAQNKALGSVYSPEGVNAGNALINKFMQPGALGRVETLSDNGTLATGQANALERSNTLMGKAGTSPDMQMATDKMKAGLGGYTSQEYQASREQMMRGQQSNLATGTAQLAKAQARGKVFGAAASAQNANLIASNNQSKDQLEQDLMVKNIDEQQERVNEFGKYSSDTQKQGYEQAESATNAYNKTAYDLRNENLDREKLNLGQANAETASQIGLFTGAGGSALAQKNTEESQKIQKQGIAAINGTGPKGKAQDKAGKTWKKAKGK